MSIKIPDFIGGTYLENNEDKLLSRSGLTSYESIAHTQNVLTTQEDETLTYYIHKEIGTSYLGSYLYNTAGWITVSNDNKIESVGHSELDETRIDNIFEDLDQLIDLDFKKMDHYNGSALDIYSVSSIGSYAMKDDFDDDELLGVSIPQSTNIGSW